MSYVLDKVTLETYHTNGWLHSFHWLLIKERIIYYICVLTYKCLNSVAPVYLAQLIVPYTPVRSLCSWDKNLLHVPKSKLKTFGDRSLMHASPCLLNTLPLDVCMSDSLYIFKNKLKTFLFDRWKCCIIPVNSYRILALYKWLYIIMLE